MIWFMANRTDEENPAKPAPKKQAATKRLTGRQAMAASMQKQRDARAAQAERWRLMKGSSVSEAAVREAIEAQRRGVLKGSPSPQPEDQGPMEADRESNDELIKSVLPVFYEMALAGNLDYYPITPDADDLELKENIKNVRAELEKRGLTPS
jgi:hypothetical protein